MTNTTNTTNSPAPGVRSRARRRAIVGVAAGLLGGSAAGLMLTVPTLTSAAGDDTSAVVALQDDTSDDPADQTVDETSDDRPDAGARLREVLQELVDDGTITADQADAVTAHLVEHRPDPGAHRGHVRHARHVAVETAADAIGIDATTLHDELRSGSTIAEVATANGVDVEVVIDALVAEASARLDTAVENGSLSEDEAATRLAELTDDITERVDEGPPARD